MIYNKFYNPEPIYYFCEIDYIHKTEVFKSVVGFEGIYEVSDLGRVKSLSRIVLKNGKYPFKSKIKVLKQTSNTHEYLYLSLNYNRVKKIKKVHQLVAISFLNHIPNGHVLVVNHKNFMKIDNRSINLELISARENSNLKHIKSSSKYVGVSWRKQSNKWISQIVFRGKKILLGLFESEEEADEYYQNALVCIEKGLKIKIKRTRKLITNQKPHR